ncbi:MAG: hypothetical protein JWP26_2737 [Devosia sp.]|nr:hypothetical protein [Devosia sp.]
MTSTQWVIAALLIGFVGGYVIMMVLCVSLWRVPAYRPHFRGGGGGYLYVNIWDPKCPPGLRSNYAIIMSTWIGWSALMLLLLYLTKGH